MSVHSARPCAGGATWLCPADDKAVTAICHTLEFSLHALGPVCAHSAQPFPPALSEASTVLGTQWGPGAIY